LVNGRTGVSDGEEKLRVSGEACSVIAPVHRVAPYSVLRYSSAQKICPY
jgi:hypothetical protein